MENPGEILQLCRLCLASDEVNVPIFGEPSDIRQISLKISSCLPVTITADDLLPKNICEGCSDKLDIVYNFRHSSEEAEKKLQLWLEQISANNKESISAVLKQPPDDDTDVKEETEDGHEDVTVKSSFDDDEDEDEKEEPESEPPPPKRARRSAAVKAQINLSRESDEDEDDVDMVEPLTKVEDDSDASDGDSGDAHSSFVDLPGTSADDQPGPSGVAKDGADAPLKTYRKRAASRRKYECEACAMKFSTKRSLETHLKKIPILVKLESTGSSEDIKIYRCESCGGKITHPFCSHLCFKPKKIGVEKLRRPGRPKQADEPPVNISEIEPSPEEVTVDNSTIDSDSKDIESCIYCDSSMPSLRLFKHETWHREHDKAVKSLTDTKTTSRLPKNSEGLCVYCGLMKPSNKLRRHETLDHGQRDMRKVCDICGIFTCPTYIREHMRTHDTVKSFKCDLCDKEFFRRKALARHKLVHSDVARYVCSVCGKSFKIRFNLRVHIRSHEDVKPFPCSVCKKTFTTKQWRDSHLKTHGILDGR